MGVVRVIVILLRAFLLPRAALAVENLALRQQLGVLQRSVKRPRLRRRDRILWVWPSRLWADWQSSLVIVKPETVVRWHRQGFRLYWRWKSRKQPGRPRIGAEKAQRRDRAALAAKMPPVRRSLNRLWTPGFVLKNAPGPPASVAASADGVSGRDKGQAFNLSSRHPKGHMH